MEWSDLEELHAVAAFALLPRRHEQAPEQGVAGGDERKGAQEPEIAKSTLPNDQETNTLAGKCYFDGGSMLNLTAKWQRGLVKLESQF